MTDLGNLKTIRLTCRKCGVVIEMEISNPQCRRLHQCPVCHDNFTGNPEYEGNPILGLCRAIQRANELAGTVKVEFPG